jgi:hypothetical protein
LEEHVMTGAMASATVTVCEHWLRLPQASAACQVRVAVKVLPHAGLVMVLRTIIALESVLLPGVGLLKFHAEPHGTVLSPAQASVGPAHGLVTVVFQVEVLSF